MGLLAYGILILKPLKGVGVMREKTGYPDLNLECYCCLEFELNRGKGDIKYNDFGALRMGWFF